MALPTVRLLARSGAPHHGSMHLKGSISWLTPSLFGYLIGTRKAEWRLMCRTTRFTRFSRYPLNFLYHPRNRSNWQSKTVLKTDLGHERQNQVLIVSGEHGVQLGYA